MNPHYILIAVACLLFATVTILFFWGVCRASALRDEMIEDILENMHE